MLLFDALTNTILSLPTTFVWHTILPAFLFAYVFHKSAITFIVWILSIIFLMILYITIDSVLSYFIKPDYLYDIVSAFYLMYIAIFFIFLRTFKKRKRKYFNKR